MGEKKNRAPRVDSLQCAAGRSCGLLVLLVVAVWGSDTRALGLALFETPRERAVGLGHPGESLVIEGLPPGAGGRWRVEAGEWFLFGVDGLRTSAVAVEVEKRGWECLLSAAVLGAPVGREYGFGAGVSVPFAGRVRLGAALRLDTVDIEGCARSHLLTLSVSALLRVADSVVLVSRAANIRLAGESVPGASASVGVVLSPVSVLCGVARLEVSPAGLASFGVSSRVRVADRLLVSLGYEEDTGSLAGSIWICVGGLGVDAGSTFHPVLGVSQALYLSWGRGW